MQTKDNPSSAKTKSRTAGPLVNQHQQIIQTLLSIIQRRMRAQSIFTRLACYAFWALLLTSAMILLSRLVRLPNIPSAVVLIPITLASILAIGLAFVRKI
ncbi:MAG: hypothetical protein OXT74_06605, partial [Candidatus Poribacteria bacterium]|nr:hypothetical protein [Candidatus Poribacteria bacterium]